MSCADRSEEKKNQYPQLFKWLIEFHCFCKNVKKQMTIEFVDLLNNK